MAADGADFSPSMIWLNGAVMPVVEARISPFDHGFLVGDGAFETLIAYRGQAFATRRHWERLCRSCAGLGFDAPSVDVFREGMAAVIAANGLSEMDARVRVTVTSGVGPLGSDRGGSALTVVMAATPVKPWGPSERVITVPWPRLENGALTGLKTTSYGENVKMLAEARKQGAGEAVCGNTRGELCEGTGSNLFIVRDLALHTPPLSSGCLAGVTRALVIELALGLGIEVQEETLPLTCLQDCHEAFLTSSTREVHPVSHIDGRELQRVAGPVTRRLQAAFRELADNEIDP